MGAPDRDRCDHQCAGCGALIFSVLFESLQGVHVDLDAEAWFLWDGQFAIDQLKIVLDEVLAEQRVGEFGGEVFEEWTMGCDGGEVGAG